MKTASSGLLELPVVRVNARGGCPPDPPSVGDVRSGPPFFVFFKKRFLANERDIIFGEGVKDNYKKPHKTLSNKWRAS